MKVSGAESAEVLSAASAAITATLCDPGASAGSASSHDRMRPTGAVPIWPPSRYTRTLAASPSAVPVATKPPPSGVVTVGAGGVGGATLSIVTRVCSDWALLLPAVSRASAVSE